MKPHYLYKITNTVNGKMYIGVTKDPVRRKNQHFYRKSESRVKLSLVWMAISKYGHENFTFEVICIGDKQYIYDLEVKAIKSYGTVRNGYNLRPGGMGGEGYRVKIRADDKPLYVSGFWFNNRRTCMEHLRVSASTLHGWKTAGRLGSITKLRGDSLIGKPVYVGSFWFCDMHCASLNLNTHINNLKHRIKIGNVDQTISNPGKKKREIYVEGVVYESLSKASTDTIYTKKMLRNRVIKDPENFYFIQEDTRCLIF